jgi:hypothetical protein
MIVKLHDSSKSGWSKTAIQENVRGAMATITIIRTTDGRTIGAYTARSWDDIQSTDGVQHKFNWLFYFDGDVLKRLPATALKSLAYIHD